MLPDAIDSVHILERHLFSQVLKLYVANNTASFVAAAIALVEADQSCDFSIVLQLRSASGVFVAHDSLNRTWDSPFVQRQAALLQSIRLQVGSEEKVVVVRADGEFLAHEGLQCYRREVLVRIGSVQTALLFIGEHSDPLSLLFSVHRTSGLRVFDSLDLARLEAFRRYIENAWSLLSQRLVAQVLVDGISLAVRNYHLGTVMLDSRLRIIWHNRASRASILAWEGDSQGHLKMGRRLGSLPADILTACEALRTEWIASPGSSRLRKPHLVRHSTTPASYATVRLCGARHAEMASPNFIVQFEGQAADAICTKSLISDALTSAERQVANLVRQGMSNQEIASELGKSVDAVKFHLHRMFKKAGVGSRSRLMLALASTK